MTVCVCVKVGTLFFYIRTSSTSSKIVLMTIEFIIKNSSNLQVIPEGVKRVLNSEENEKL